MKTDTEALSSDMNCCWEVAEGWGNFWGVATRPFLHDLALSQASPQVSSGGWHWRAFVCPDIFEKHFKNNPKNDSEQICISFTLTFPHPVLWSYFGCAIVLNKNHTLFGGWWNQCFLLQDWHTVYFHPLYCLHSNSRLSVTRWTPITY